MNAWNNQQVNTIKMAIDDMRLVAIPVSLLEELLQVCDWHRITVNGQREGETVDNHPDWDSVEYLVTQTSGIQLQAKGYLPLDSPMALANNLHDRAEQLDIWTDRLEAEKTAVAAELLSEVEAGGGK